MGASEAGEWEANGRLLVPHQVSSPVGGFVIGGGVYDDAIANVSIITTVAAQDLILTAIGRDFGGLELQAASTCPN